MRKKFLLLFYIAIIFGVVQYYINYIKMSSENNSITLFDTPPQGTIHVYLDVATFPTELQLFDIIKRDKTIPKIISWNWERFPNIKNLDKYNAKTMSIPFFGHSGYYDQKQLQSALEGIKKLKDNDFVFHTNMMWSNLILPFLKVIPKEKIKHIHIYEDGLGNVLSSSIATKLITKDASLNAKEKMEYCLKSECHPFEYKFSFHYLYPTTYHISFWEEIQNEPRLTNFLNLIKGANVEPIDLEKESKELTYNQKKELLEILDFDMDFYLDLIKDKKVNFFVVGHFLKAEQKYLKEWYEMHKHDENSINFIKGESKAMENLIIPAYIFPNQVPFEMLLLSGLMPDNVSGVESSLFYSLPKENIGKIIFHNDYTFELMKNLKNLDESQIQKIEE